MTGARQRFRAVLMTAPGFLPGLMPFVTAAVSLGGMVAATFLVILIVPALYAFFERPAVGRHCRAWGREAPDRAGTDPEETTTA